MNKPGDITNEITRRQWLLRLGEVGVLAGVSGFVPEVLGSAFQVQGKAVSLPPGLYDPSADAMVHALSHHGLVIPPPGSEAEYAVPSNSPFRPLFFSQEEFEIAGRIAEIILGTIDASALSEVSQWIDLWFHSAEAVRKAARSLDPMHRVLAVAYYGEEEVQKLENLDLSRTAREGFAALEHVSAEKYGKGFAQIAPEQQFQIIREAIKQKDEAALAQFLDALRNEAIHGYYTTAAGLKELDYKGNAYNPECPGCELSSDKSTD